LKSIRSRISDGLEPVTFGLFCIAAATYPFSVAAANVALGSALVTGLLGGQLAKGAQRLWIEHRAFTLAWMLYLALLPLGLIWSMDRPWGLHVIARQWYWLLIPLAVSVLSSRSGQRTFLAILSISLTAHLAFCVGQLLGWTDFTKDGSTAMDPTGHIGHIGFGFVYGVWAGWLLHWGLLQYGWRRWGAWLLAAWSVTMVFLAAGRSGYLIVPLLLLAVAWKLLRFKPWLKVAAALLVIATGVAALAYGPGKARILWTMSGIQAIEKGNFRKAEARWSLWYAAIETWRTHTPMGVGTGGYPKAAAEVKLAHPGLWYGGTRSAHPHNMYLLALSRWGPLGTIALLVLLYLWIRTAWRLDWHHTDAASLIALPALAMAIHGLSASSLEEHFPAILAALLLGVGLAAAGTDKDIANPSPFDG